MRSYHGPRFISARIQFVFKLLYSEIKKCEADTRLLLLVPVNCVEGTDQFRHGSGGEAVRIPY